MIMLRHDIPLCQSEELGYYLGLGVTQEDKYLFYNPRIIEKLPKGFAIPSTRINLSAYEPNKAFKKLAIPLKFSQKKIHQFKSFSDFKKYLSKIESDDKDSLVCFDWEFLNPGEFEDYVGGYGHVCLFDRFINDNEVRLIDPEHGYPKWPTVKADLLYKAMQSHGPKRGAGLWNFDYKGEKL